VVNGVRLHPLPGQAHARIKVFADLSDEVFDARATPDRQEAWFRENGPIRPGCSTYLEQRGGEFDLVLFWSYRYAPAFFGLPLVADRAVLVPTAEEDPAITLDVLETTSASRGLRIPDARGAIAGVAPPANYPLEPRRSSAPASTGARRRGTRRLDALGVPPQFVLYLGRVDRNKGCHTMFEYFEEHLADGGPIRRWCWPARLEADDPVATRASVRSASWTMQTRDALLAHATALIVPSPYESLSMSLLEGWNHGTPALVNAFCAVLQGQARRANGGLWYRSAREFSAGLTWLLTHPAETRALGSAGRAYVDREYRWPSIMTAICRPRWSSQRGPSMRSPSRASSTSCPARF
jgi:glycosyltransferase involved in cell wall biosynthesis